MSISISFYYMRFSSKGFTLLELMIVIAILGILMTALFPAFSNYIQRWRDTSRVSHIDIIAKMTWLYFSEHDEYPTFVVDGCVNNTALIKYGVVPSDPISTKYNACNTITQYGYAMSTGILSNPNAFALVALMEQTFGGNYWQSLAGFTGELTSTAYNSGLTQTSKWAGNAYIRIP